MQNSLSFRTFNFNAGQKKFGTRPQRTCREQRGSCVITRRPELTPSISIIHLYIMTADLSHSFFRPHLAECFFMILLRILILVAPLVDWEAAQSKKCNHLDSDWLYSRLKYYSVELRRVKMRRIKDLQFSTDICINWVVCLYWFFWTTFQ